MYVIYIVNISYKVDQLKGTSTLKTFIYGIIDAYFLLYFFSEFFKFFNRSKIIINFPKLYNQRKVLPLKNELQKEMYTIFSQVIQKYTLESHSCINKKMIYDSPVIKNLKYFSIKAISGDTKTENLQGGRKDAQITKTVMIKLQKTNLEIR